MNNYDQIEDIEINGNSLKNYKKRRKLEFLKKSIYGLGVFLAVYAAHVMEKDIEIKQKCNMINTFTMLSYDNELQIPVINTSDFENFEYFNKATDDSYYKNSNFFENIIENETIGNNISFTEVMKNLNIEMVNIDGVIYSDTGYLTKITYTIQNTIFEIYTSKTFKNDGEVLSYIYNKEFNNNKINLNYFKYETKEVVHNSRIPTIKKNKENGKILVKEPNEITYFFTYKTNNLQ